MVDSAILFKVTHTSIPKRFTEQKVQVGIGLNKRELAKGVGKRSHQLTPTGSN